jgi:protein-S-isoprenylcysteine O-methyltransferase Ste14
MFLLFPLSFIIVAAMLFWPAGTLDYWQGWIFLATLFIPFLFVASYLLKYDPELAERRMRFKEKEINQKILINISKIVFFIGFIIPGFDHRYGWSDVPAYLVVLSDLLIFFGYMLIFCVFKENSFTSRIVEVEKGQKVITTGPYSKVRHPMYSGFILMYLFIPLALGSYWAMIFFIPIVAIIIFRALDEEKVLLKDLEGYKEYYKKVRYRMIPGIW